MSSLAPLATALVALFEQLRMSDVEVVGGKNASLGEMISQLAAAGVRVPGGFATTAHAFREFLRHAPWRGGRFLGSCLMFVTYATAGAQVGATPDGRRRGGRSRPG